MKNKTECPTCLSKEINFIKNYSNFSKVYSDMKLYRCSNCEMVFSYPFPSKEALKKYNETYFDSAHGGHSMGNHTIAVFKGLASIRVVYLNRFLKSKRINSEKILEIGPGPGYFADNWIKKHKETEYFAIETDETCYSNLEKIGVKLIKEENIINYKNKIDVVVISHVLEHVSDPYEFLSFSYNFLKKGGVLFIEVPCKDHEHKNIMEPHLLFFDKKPLQLLLKRTGFYNIQTNYFGKPISVLKNDSFLKIKINSLINKIILLTGLYHFLKLNKDDLLSIDTKFVRFAVYPYMAHIESKDPAWWLRSLAIKK